MELSLAKVETEEQIALTAELAAGIWREYYCSIISVEQIEYMLGRFQTPDAISAQITEQGYEYYLMDCGGEWAGYLAIQPNVEQGKLFLSKFYVRQECRGRGYASQAMAKVVELCRKHGLRAVWLTVNRHNEKAVAVYRKKGFCEVSTQIADIGNGYVMDDYIMELSV